jgi:hypothetical protein
LEKLLGKDYGLSQGRLHDDDDDDNDVVVEVGRMSTC